MKTYNIVYAFLALLVLSCSKSDEGSGGDNDPKSIDADYAVLLKSGSLLSPQLLNANSDLLLLNPASSALAEQSIPSLSLVSDSKILLFHANQDGSAKIVSHDFSTDLKQELDVFVDLKDSTWTAHAMTLKGNTLYVGYEVQQAAIPSLYKVRVIDMSASASMALDVDLDKQPVDLAFANNRLFVLTLDVEITDENSLSVIDSNSNSIIIEMGLGYNVRRIFKTITDDIIISYDELHTTINSNTLSLAYTNYLEGTEPNFTANTTNHFDQGGRMYYHLEPGSHSAYPKIPGVYDFDQNLVVFYAYENFLSDQKRNFEYEIETTTAVGYDSDNEMILIGYKKTSGSNKGGLLRIKPAPDPAVIDNIDLDGVPFEIIVN